VIRDEEVEQLKREVRRLRQDMDRHMGIQSGMVTQNFPHPNTGLGTSKFLTLYAPEGIFWDDGTGTLVELTEEEAPPVAGLKTASGGYFTIPAQPSSGTGVASDAAGNTYGLWTQMIAATAADIYIVGVRVNIAAATTGANSVALDIGVGAAASEVSIGEVPSPSMDPGTDSGTQGATTMLPYPIPVASGVRISCRTSQAEAASRTHVITLICINQADLVSI